MSLSLIIFILIPIFLLPALIMTTNRIRIYFYCALAGSFAALVLNLAVLIAGANFTEVDLASPFLGMFSSFFNYYPSFTTEEKCHIICMFIYLVIYLIVYLIAYIFIKIFYIGKNPAIRRPVKFITKIMFGLGFFALTYLPLCLFLINIRLLFPFEDGLLSFFFDWIYLLEA